MKYTVNYYFDGHGKAIVEANSKEEAEDKFFDGIIEAEQEWGEDYNIDSTTEGVYPLKSK